METGRRNAKKKNTSQAGRAETDASKRGSDELTAIFENASIGIVFTRDSSIMRCNRRAAELFGYHTAEDLTGKPSITIFPDEDSYTRLGREAGPLLGAGHSFNAEWLMRKLDGSAVWCNLYGKAVDPLATESGTVWILEDITEAKLAKEALQKSKQLLDNTFSNMDQGITIFDADLNMLGINQRFADLLDFPASVCAPGAHFSDFMRYNAMRGDYGPGDIEELTRNRVELARRFEPHHFERERPDGTVLEIRGRPIPGGGFVTTYTDVTKRAQAERSLRESEARFRSLTQLSSDWFWEQDAEFRFTRMEGQHITGEGTDFDADIGKTFAELGFEVSTGQSAHDAALGQRKPFREAVMRRTFADGTVHHIRVSGEPVFNAAGGFMGYRGVGRDITQEKRAVEQIQYLATHDGLTSLPNSRLFHEMLGLAIQSARRYERKLGLLFIDLDHFKEINDTYGHDAGDSLLKEVADRLYKCLRSSDVVARLGGDEFVVLVQEVGDAAQVAQVARKILAAATQPVEFQGHECVVTASIGICMYPADAMDQQSMVKNADSAMYAAKEKGKNNFQFFGQQPDAAV
jgi:diguanylate cyclase (GGDEF)-like protein/PAS domain S-box-containing protein